MAETSMKVIRELRTVDDVNKFEAVIIPGDPAVKMSVEFRRVSDVHLDKDGFAVPNPRGVHYTPNFQDWAVTPNDI